MQHGSSSGSVGGNGDDGRYGDSCEGGNGGEGCCCGGVVVVGWSSKQLEMQSQSRLWKEVSPGHMKLGLY